MDRPKVKKDKRLVKKTETVNEILIVDVDVLSCSCAAPQHSCFEIGSQIVAPPQFEFYPGLGGGREVDYATGRVTVDGNAPGDGYSYPSGGSYVSGDYCSGIFTLNLDSAAAGQAYHATPVAYSISDQVTDTMTNYMIDYGTVPSSQNAQCDEYFIMKPDTRSISITPL